MRELETRKPESVRPEGAPKEEGQAKRALTPKGHVLVVDDEPGVRFTLAEFMRLAGHTCEVAGGVNEALEILRRSTFDVVISDIILPDAHGTDFLKTVREAYPETEVIMITGAPDAETAIDSLRGRAFDYLPKPVTRQRIVNSVGNAIRLSALRQRNRRLEERNRQYQENLEGLVAQRTAELSLLTRRLMDIQESERNALSREIHDELGQSLIALKLKLQHMHRSFAPTPPLDQECNSMVEFLDGIIDDCRRMSHRLSPLVLEHLGLPKALSRLVENLSSSTTIRFDVSVDLEGLPENPQRDANLYRIAQEALTNIIKHARASHVHFEARRVGDLLRLRIQDDGRGFDANRLPEESHSAAGMGLLVMRERAALIGGTASIRSETGGGTVIEVTVPW